MDQGKSQLVSSVQDTRLLCMDYLGYTITFPHQIVNQLIG